MFDLSLARVYMYICTRGAAVELRQIFGLFDALLMGRASCSPFASRTPPGAELARVCISCITAARTPLQEFPLKGPSGGKGHCAVNKKVAIKGIV